MVSSHFLKLSLGHLAMVIVSASIPSTAPGSEWVLVGYLNMTDPTQQCPDSWLQLSSPIRSCGKKSSNPCDSVTITTSGAAYQTVCGRFRGYQIGSPDAFRKINDAIEKNIETYYVDGVTVTYGSPGSRHHVYTYAAGYEETSYSSSCPCTGGGDPPPLLVGSDYYCESGDPGPGNDMRTFYTSDVLWDGKQCGGDESTCCNPPDLPWFCKTFPSIVYGDLEVRICTDQGNDDENVAIQSFELYIQPNYAAVASGVAALFIVIIVVVLVAVGSYCIFKRKSNTTWSPMALSPVTYSNNEVDFDQRNGMLEDVNKTSPILQSKSSNAIA
eukprot:Em0001g2266a